jgi:hypothetical protein
MMELEFEYHQVWFKEEDIGNTTFNMMQGLCEGLIIPFSLGMHELLHAFNE